MNSDKGFWTFIERFKLVIEIVVTLIVIAPVVLAGANLITTGLSAVVPAWSVLVAAIAALALGYLVARRPKVVLGTPKKSIIRREFYSVVWEIDQVSGQVDGPFCKTCYVRMIAEYYDDRYGRGSVTDLVFVCRNPECRDRY